MGRVWPHKEYRQDQKEVVIDILKAFYDDGYDNYILSAPTGFGKSPVCLTVAHIGGMLSGATGSDVDKMAEDVLRHYQEAESMESGYYVTPQNILLDQLQDDYGSLPIFSMFKGRSNYTCTQDRGATCQDGPCRFDNKLSCSSYVGARERALGSPVANTNFSLYMVHPDLEKRPMLVVDEAHMMPQYVEQHVEVELRQDHLNQFVWDMPNFDEFEDYVDWMRPKAQDLKERAEELREKLHVESSMQNVNSRLVSEYNRVERLENKFSRLITDWKFNEEEWVVNHTKQYDNRKGEYVDTVKFQPITPYRFMDFLVFGKGEKTLISSATPPGPELLSIEADNTARLKLDSPFPPSNRPCHYENVGMMSNSKRDENLPDLIDYTLDVSEGKTILHAHTYQFAGEIADALSDEVGDDDVLLQKSDSRESSLNRWKGSDAKYYVSVNMYDGIDLKDDLCRTNIICVVPFPYLGDPQVKRRKEKEGDRFYNWRTAMRIQQAYGRTTRSKDDHSETHIIDSNFGWFYSQNKNLFFDWFKEALEWHD